MPDQATTTVVTDDSQSTPLQSQGNGVASSTVSVPPKEALLQPVPEVSRPGRGEAAEFSAPELFLNRELTWLAFNRRVFEEALDQHNPPLERVKFLAITASNLDEFFMKRIGVLKRRARQEATTLADGASGQRHLQVLRDRIVAMTTQAADIYRIIRPALSQQGIHLLEWSELTDDERQQANEVFRRKIYPVLTPLVVDPSHPFPFLSNLSQSRTGSRS